MSHEFLILPASNKPNPKTNPMDQLKVMQSGPHGHFQGLAEGALYKAFDGQQFFAGPSGCFGGKVISKAEADKGLTSALQMLANYPDPTRADDLKAFYRDHVAPASADAQFYVHFF